MFTVPVPSVHAPAWEDAAGNACPAPGCGPVHVRAGNGDYGRNPPMAKDGAGW
ncbi:hypothetical protein [Komagataeibacter europaeus]|uniref:hypothetical protein n=1 Tax=Komagataeibacter europaeus TaxID=33995 RepID=UPI000237DCCD|nr:hypothetical protein [Komagataeibacter europaeus]